MSDFVKYIKKEFGDVIEDTLEEKEYGVISTGSLALDAAIGVGGIPKTKFTEIAGAEGTGKTTICLQLSKNALDQGDGVLYVDVENMLDFEYVRNILGQSYKPESFIVVQPETGEDALLIVEEGLKTGQFGLVIIDSVGALTPKKEKEKNLDDSTVGETARLLSRFLRRAAYHVKHNDVAVVFINQVRDKIGSFMGGYETPGGHALKHFTSVRIILSKGKMIQVKGDSIGVQTPFVIKKNKVGVPYRSFTIPILFGSGVDVLGDVLDFAKMLGVIKTRGPYYMFGDEKLGQGRVNALEFLSENKDVLDKVKEVCYNALKSNKTGVEQVDEIVEDDE